MNSAYLIDYLGYIDEQYILQAEPPAAAAKFGRKWVLRASVAACLAIVITGVFFLRQKWMTPQNNPVVLPDTSDSAVTPGCDVLEVLPSIECLPAKWLTEPIPAARNILFGGLYIGQTPEEVEALYGKPTDILDGGNEYYYMYETFSVVFLPTTQGYAVKSIGVHSNFSGELPFGWKLGETKEAFLQNASQEKSAAVDERYDSGTGMYSAVIFEQQNIRVVLPWSKDENWMYRIKELSVEYID